jgi:hypothetical protein
MKYKSYLCYLGCNLDRNLSFLTGPLCEPGNSVSIVSGCGLDNRAIEVRFSAEAKGLFL